MHFIRLFEYHTICVERLSSQGYMLNCLGEHCQHTSVPVSYWRITGLLTAEGDTAVASGTAALQSVSRNRLYER